MRTKLTIAFAITILTAGVAFAAGQDYQLQNSKFTPGALNPAVTQANIKDNVCKANWTSTIRPTVTYTNKLKATQLDGDYKYFIAVYGAESSKYEEDHLISLQLGGDPTNPKNLWPEPYAGVNARKKDVVEGALKRLVCSGTLKLVDAQKAILDWPSAYKKYVTPADAKTPDNSDG